MSSLFDWIKKKKKKKVTFFKQIAKSNIQFWQCITFIFNLLKHFPFGENFWINFFFLLKKSPKITFSFSERAEISKHKIKSKHWSIIEINHWKCKTLRFEMFFFFISFKFENAFLSKRLFLQNHSVLSLEMVQLENPVF